MARQHGSRTRVSDRNPVARDRAWQSMRILRRFTLPDLVATAEIGSANARKYARGLMASGYLRIAQVRQSGRKGGHQVYLLIRNTGPLAPRLQSDGNTYDANQHKTYEGGLGQ